MDVLIPEPMDCDGGGLYMDVLIPEPMDLDGGGLYMDVLIPEPMDCDGGGGCLKSVASLCSPLYAS
jgi:hypothetical protein